MKQATILFLFLILCGSGIAALAQSEVESLLKKAYDLDMTNPDEAIKCARQAYQIGQEKNDPVICSRALNSYAWVVMLEGDYELSLSLYFNALSYCPEDSLSIKAHIYSSIGWVYTKLDDKEKANNYINKGLDLFKKLSNLSGIATSYNNKGLVYYYDREYDKADYYFRLALDISRKIGNQRYIAGIINNLCMSPGDSQAKIRLIQESITINKSLDLIWCVAENYNNLAKQYYYLHHYSDALLALDMAKEYAQKVKAKDLLGENYLQRSLVYAAQKDYPLAYSWLQKQIEISREIQSEKSIREIERKISNRELLRLKQEYELQQKEHDLAILRRNWTITIIGMLLCMLLFLICFRWFKRKKELELIARQYELEQSQRKVMELEIKEKEETIGNIDNELHAAKEKLGYMLLFLRSRNELLEKIRNMIRAAYKMEPTEQLTYLKKINTFIAQYQVEEQKDELSVHIEEQNSAFLKRLQERYPDITPNEKNLSVLLRMNLSSKEMALITGNSIKTISMGRHRLRKHLELGSEEDIATFLRRI